MADTKPAIVIVPGAWHVPEHYEPTALLLRSMGYETVSVRHPSVSVSRDSGNMLHKDATVTCDVMRKLLNDETKDVVLVMHSYGGISGSEAVAMVKSWLDVYGQPGHGRVRRMVFLAAHVVEKGEALMGGGRTLNVESFDITERNMVTHKTPYERYYADTSLESAQPALDLLQPMAYSAMTSETEHTGWKDYSIPCTYITCRDDIAVPREQCEKYVARLRDAGVDVTTEEIEGGHSPFWITPERLAEVLGRVIG